MATIKEYWLPEATIGTNTLADAAMFYFGGYIDQAGSGLTEINIDNQINEIEKSGQYYKEFTIGNQPLDSMTVKYLVVNGLCAKWALGAVTNDENGLHTIVNFTTARKPTISVWRQGDFHKDYAKGLVCGSSDFAYQLGSPLMVTQTFKGRANGKTTDTAASVTFPDGVDSYFQKLSFFNWNGFAYAIEGFRVQYVQSLVPFMGPLGFYADINEFTTIEAIWTVIFAEGVDISAIITDLFTIDETGANTGTARVIEAKVLKAADNAKYIDFYNAAAIPIALRKTAQVGQPTRYEMVFLGGTSVITCVDGVADAKY